jgi:hypothetical protein
VRQEGRLPRSKRTLRTLSAIAQRTLGRDIEGHAQEQSGFKNEFFIFAPGSSKQIHSNRLMARATSW